MQLSFNVGMLQHGFSNEGVQTRSRATRRASIDAGYQDCGYQRALELRGTEARERFGLRCGRCCQGLNDVDARQLSQCNARRGPRAAQGRDRHGRGTSAQ